MNASDMGPQRTSQATEPRESTSSDDSHGLTVEDDGAAGTPAEGTASHPAGRSDGQSKSSPKVLCEVLANLPPRVWPILTSSSSFTLDHNRLKIIFLLSIHMSPDLINNHVALMDTDPPCNLIKRHVTSSLGFTLEKYQGMPIQLRPARSPIAPESQVTFSWNVMGKADAVYTDTVYTDTFLVVDDSAGHDKDFDILFGE
ncbi:MAG: hypothetical protein L6R36_001549 [Xanthoria steineri]|nr:MAG: hypothetical protein L6R36_001549 [Xanthoria steineri]